MQPMQPQTSTCPCCGGPLEKTSGGGLGCAVCLLRAGIGIEDSDTEALEDSSTLRHFGVYEIERREDGSLYELGHGGMGTTYRAIDTTLQREVALKVIKVGVASRSTEARERFLREARAAAALRHENIATVFQFGISEETGQFFYAMELVEGETLEERVRRTGPLSVRATIEIARQATSALAAAEKRSLIHRDLKPANLMLVSADDEERGSAEPAVPTLKIIDFGLAKVLTAPADPMRLTHGGFVGTPAFASPEQFENSALDVHSDIYSLGITLWFALTEKTPFAGHSMAEIRRAQQSDALPIEQLKAAHVPSYLTALLKSMLATEAAARPGTHELAAHLQRCAAQAGGERRANVALAAAAILILGASAFLVFVSLRTGNAPAPGLGVADRSPPRVQNLPPNPAAPEKSIAVLPFENRSEEKQNAYFAEGVQGEILTDLAKVADLKVISRTSVMQYGSGSQRNVREIGQQLGVAHVVEGSVQRSGDRVRVNVELIDARTDRQLWAQTYDRDVADVFAIQSEIAKAITDQLQAKLNGHEEQASAAKPTNNPEAYDAYLRGLAFEARSTYSNDALREAIDSYERAVQVDPNFALAWAQLSRADANLYFVRADQTAARRDAAKKALEAAQRLEPDSPEAQLALGYYQYWVLRDYRLAEDTFARLRKVLPGSSEVLFALGSVARREANWDASIAYCEDALAVDPRNVELLSNTAWTYAMLRRFPTALNLYNRALDIMPNDLDLITAKASVYQAQQNLKQAANLLSEINAQSPDQPFITKMTQLRLERNHAEAIRLLQARQAHFQFASEIDKGTNQVILAFAQRLAGDNAGAKATARQAHNTLKPLCEDQPDNSFFAQQLALANATLEDKKAALSEAERAIKLLPSTKDPLSGPTREEVLALIQMMFGETSRPISTLNRLLRTPYISWLYGPMPVTPAVLRLDPIWDPLRSDPAFQKLCQEK